MTSGLAEPTRAARDLGHSLQNLAGITVSTRSNALYNRCATEHGRPRQPVRNRERAGQAGRAGSQRETDPPTLPLTSDDPSRLSPRTADKRFRWSGAILWAWVDLNLRPHPETKIARVATGSTAPRRAELGRAARFSSLVAATSHAGLISYQGLSAVQTGVFPGRRRASGAKLSALSDGLVQVVQATRTPCSEALVMSPAARSRPSRSAGHDRRCAGRRSWPGRRTPLARDWPPGTFVLPMSRLDTPGSDPRNGS